MMCQVLKRPPAPDLAYIFHPGQPQAPTLLFLCGYRSDMTGSKASALAAWVPNTPYGLLRFDYSGHGQSGGQMRDLTLSDWLQDTVDLLAAMVPTGPLIVIGSSMGGWVALRLALAQPERIVGIIGIAAAPDFTVHMAEHDLTAAERTILAQTGLVERPSTLGPDPYVITQALLDDGAKHTVLDRRHDLTVPMILFQGDQDPVVPVQAPDLIAQAFPQAEVRITRIPDGDHGLSRPQDLAMLYQAIDDLAARSIISGGN